LIAAEKDRQWINLNLSGTGVIWLIYGTYINHVVVAGVGIVNIDEELHDQLRKASGVSCRSINAQAAFWIRIGMLRE
jgi:hypothetical protein